MNYTLITGACGGLGSAFTDILAERGTPLFLTGRSEERLTALQASLKAKDPALEIEIFPCDLRSEESRAALFEYADGKGIIFDRLIYVAGVDTQMPFEQYDEGRILTQTRVNFEGAVSFIRRFLGRSPLDGKTEILCIGSVTSILPEPYFALYAATKKALEYFCMALRTELKGRAKVTVVLPGSMPTREDIVKSINAHGGYSRLTVLPPRKVAERALKAVRKNKMRVIIGFWNKLTNFGSHLIPMSWRMHFAANIWKKTTKDFYGEERR